MTSSALDALLVQAERLLEKPGAPGRPEPAGQAALHEQARPGVAPEAESPYGRGEAGYRRWRLENVSEQAARYRAGRVALQNPPIEPQGRAVAVCAGETIEIRKDGCRWLLYRGTPLKRVEGFATPWFDHARRTAELWFGCPTGGWRFD
jgi:hypothetical protein